MPESTAVVEEQVIVGDDETIKLGYGLIVIVNVFAGPAQPLYVGVAVTTAICCDVTVGEVYEPIFPDPDDPIPTTVFVFAQAIVAPAGEGENVTPATVPPAPDRRGRL